MPDPHRAHHVPDAMARLSRHAPRAWKDRQGNHELEVEAGLGAVPAPVAVEEARNEEPKALEAFVVGSGNLWASITDLTAWAIPSRSTAT